MIGREKWYSPSSPRGLKGLPSADVSMILPSRVLFEFLMRSLGLPLAELGRGLVGLDVMVIARGEVRSLERGEGPRLVEGLGVIRVGSMVDVIIVTRVSTSIV